MCVPLQDTGRTFTLSGGQRCAVRWSRWRLSWRTGITWTCLLSETTHTSRSSSVAAVSSSTISTFSWTSTGNPVIRGKPTLLLNALTLSIFFASISRFYTHWDIHPLTLHRMCRCKGLMLLETYTALPSDKLQNILPQILTIEKEVTGNPDHSMFNLSLREEWNSTNKFCHNLNGEYLFTASTS